MLDLPNLSNTPVGLVTLVPPFNYDRGTEVISSEVLIHTENAVLTDEGRYFVAGEHSDPNLGWGIYEVVKAASGFEVRQIVPGILEVGSTRHSCWFHGLTSDGNYLYATAAVHLQGNPNKTDFGALFRILPQGAGVQVAIAHYGPQEVHGYNGMAVGLDGSLYMSNSFALTDGSNVAIYKVEILDADRFEIRIAPWLVASLLRDIGPNGIQIADETMFYASGKGLHRIAMGASDPRTVTPIYIPLNPNNVLDDLTIMPDGRIAVAELDFFMNFNGFEGWGINQIVTVDPSGGLLNKHATLTSPYTVSSLVYSQGELFTNGKLVATSWFHGGIREIELP